MYCADENDRKDLEQEILIQIWKSLDKYDDTYAITTWLYRISMNVAISHYRKVFKTKSKIVRLDSNLLEYIKTDETNDNSYQK